MLFDRVVRPVLYRVGRNDPELVHERTLAALRRVADRPAVLSVLSRRYAVRSPVTVFGVRFPNRVGLAAGMDKNGAVLPAWPALGFGFVEVGTVTRHAQPGNPRPRLFTLPRTGALVNRMGFNNAGADVLAERLAAVGPLPVPLGVSIGKSRVTDLADAVSDYRHSLQVLYPHADYFAVNVSSPNTPGLRRLQDRAALGELLGSLQARSAELAGQRPATPLLVKVAPDLTDDALAELLEVVAEHRLAGIIATNTTLSRDGLHPDEEHTGRQTGGLSGKPLTPRALEVVRFVAKHTGGAVPIIGVGGISTPDDALRMLDAGASLMQLYTGFIYSGPALVRRIARELPSA
ncbi:MAG: quinone-dependent dihydroorotate dehydrogenase [Thermocrispum sp.]